MTHWEVGKKEELEPVDAWKRPYHQAGASDIEITAYALLAYNTNNDLIGAIPIVKWLASQRNPNGGFSSTQVRGHSETLDRVIFRHEKKNVIINGDFYFNISVVSVVGIKFKIISVKD